MKIMEEYFSADRLLELPIDSVINIIAESNGVQFTVSLIGVDNGKSVIISLPSIERATNPSAYAEVISVGAAFEMQGIHDGRVIAFESTITDIYNQRLLICTFPEMIETRRLRKEIRFPCALSCDISGQGDETYGAITNISIGGCLLNVHEDNKLWLIEKALESQQPIDLDVFLPIAELPVVIAGVVKSMTPQCDGLCQIGIAFTKEYDCIHRYLQALHLDSVSPFFN
jgi:c-di-GMP-binding flagellar brake protein YcgR